MLHNSVGPRTLATERSPWLRGTLEVPGDAAISHLALIAGAMARGESLVAGALPSDGILVTVKALEALGARLEQHGGRWHVAGLGISGLLEPAGPLDFGGSALGLELVMGLAGIYDFPTAFRANGELSQRSFSPLLAGLRAFGVEIGDPDQGRPPLTLHGPRLAMPLAYTLPPEAPATKAALILSALSVPGRSSFLEPAPTSNHAERMLSTFGAEIETTPLEDGGRRVAITGLPNLRAHAVEVPADPALAAFGVLAASIVPGSEVTIPNVLVNPTRTALFSALVAMGASVEVHRLREAGGEEVADLVVRHTGLKGVVLARQYVTPLLHDLPLLAVAAACADGESVLELPAGLPLWEHGRIATVARGLRANGLRCQASETRLVIGGVPQVPGGGRVLTGRDADIAIAFLVLGMATYHQVTVEDPSGIEERFPGFIERFEAIGASFVRTDG